MAIPSQIGYDWFWNNYNTCMDWIKKHEVAYWKSQAMALKIENEDLLKAKNRNRWKRPTKRSRRRSKSKAHSSDNTLELDFELSPEWAQIFKESLEKKEKNKKERAVKASEVDSAFVPPQDSVNLRQKEMLELYGEGCCKILGMETVMNLAFERYIDRNSPEYWPPMPLNPSAI